MKNWFKALLLALVPILRAAGRDIIVEAIDSALFTEKDRQHRSRLRYGSTYRAPILRQRRHLERKGFEGIVMVAFHIAGPSQVLVEEWIQSRLPKSERNELLNIDLKSVNIERDEKDIYS